jgi:hypothetical protein
MGVSIFRCAVNAGFACPVETTTWYTLLVRAAVNERARIVGEIATNSF